MWNRFKEISLAEFSRIYDKLGVRFDEVVGESFYVDMADNCVRRMQKAGITEMSEGALIVPLEDDELPPLMLRKRDGTTLYATRDLCAAEYRWDRYAGRAQGRSPCRPCWGNTRRCAIRTRRGSSVSWWQRG